MSALSLVRTKSKGYRIIIVVAPAAPPDATLPAKNNKGCCFGLKGQKIFLKESLKAKNIAYAGKLFNTDTEFPLQKDVKPCSL